VLVLDSTYLKVCTDTIAWLVQNYILYNIAADYDIGEFANRIYSICWNDTHEPNMTAIKLKLALCILKQESDVSQHYYTYIQFDDINTFIQLLVDLLQFVAIPIACIVGLFLNLRVIYTVHQNREGDLREEFYSYMSINSVFSSLYCLSYALYPINYCQDEYDAGFFCSSIYNTVTAQVIKIVFIGYFGEVFKMCSNISYVFMTVMRYMLIGKEHNQLLEKLSKWNSKFVVSFALIFSLLLNIGHAFQYRINYGWGEFIFKMYTTDSSYPSNVITNHSLSVYLLVYFLINFLFFIVFNTWVEFCLLKNLRKEISEKREKLDAEIKESISVWIGGDQQNN
jgi:hypothetical protein